MAGGSRGDWEGRAGLAGMVTEQEACRGCAGRQQQGQGTRSPVQGAR